MSNHGKTAVVYTDGACVNQGLDNPRAGYGVFWGEGHPNNRSGAVSSGKQDSNRGELLAAQKAIRTAVDKGYSSIVINSDSTYVRDAVANSACYQKNSDGNRDLQQSINALKSQVDVQVQHVAAHSGHPGNAQAHLLAKAGANGRY